MTFSERQGYKTPRTELQTESMSDELRASLWNVLHDRIWDRSGFQYGGRYEADADIYPFSRRLWSHYFKRPYSEIPTHPSDIIRTIQDYFFSCRWSEVFDLLEVIIAIAPSPQLLHDLNYVLARELSGYRLVDGKFVPVTGTEEVAALEEALKDDRFGPVSSHLRSALDLLSDRKNPDYRNSIKESISAVEAMAKILSGNDKATLDEALKVLEKDGKLHGALRKGFSALYGYTSDADGIRHAMMDDESSLTVDDAKFFLLACTSFTNYLKTQM
jgi:DNA-binding transcriptional ArsR family regulator